MIGHVWKRVQRLWGGDYAQCPKPFKRWLAKHGNETITSITLVRKPVHSFIERAVNLWSRGRLAKRKQELNYDQLYHLAIVFNGRYLLEKNHVVRAIAAPTQLGSDYLHMPVPHTVTFNQLIVNGVQAQTAASGDKDSFWEYSARKSSCQSFVWYLLKGSDLANERSRDYVLQDSRTLLRGVRGTEVLTDTAGVLSSVTGLF